jgi:tetratricopeptide (TPR) repeat protein
MLFELGGKRKRFIQVIYVFLALLLGGGLIFFGIGGSAPGGLGDAIGLGGGGGNDNPEFQAKIEKAQQTLQTNPDNTKALLELARNEYLNGQAALEVDDQGITVLTEDAVNDFEAAVDAWEHYLDVTKGKPDESVAALMIQAYQNIRFESTNFASIERRLEGAQTTAEILAQARPGPNSYLALASAAYAAGDTKTAEKAADKALAAVGESSKAAMEQQLKAAKRTGAAIQKEIKRGKKSGADQVGNPFGQINEGTSTTGG